jgi:Glycosyl hydrolases family 16
MLDSGPRPSSRGHTRWRSGPFRSSVTLLTAGVLVVAAAVTLGVVTYRHRQPVPTAGVPLASAGPSSGPSGPTLPSMTGSPSASASASRCPSGCPATGAPRAGPAPPIPAAAGKRWALTFSEEFNGTDYDHGKLTPCFDWNTGGCTASFNNGREHYLPSQVKVSNGTAKLIAAPAARPIASSACQGGSCTYVAGLLSTARPRADTGQGYLYKFTYGFVESRFRFPATRGFFTAFWMLPTDPSFNYRNEIDILELLGDDPTTMYMTYNYDNRVQSYAANKGKYNNGACPVKDYSTEFVDMAVDWEPNRIAWYIDGVKCAEYTDASRIENGPMQIILNMMVDNDWQRRWNVGLTDPTLTRQLEVDYIRVYQQRPA